MKKSKKQQSEIDKRYIESGKQKIHEFPHGIPKIPKLTKSGNVVFTEQEAIIKKLK